MNLPHQSLFLLFAACISCTSPDSDLPVKVKERLTSEVHSFIIEYRDAIISADAGKIVSNYLDDPGFRWIVNDRLMSFEDQNKNAYRRTKTMDFKGDLFRNIDINILNKETAIVLSTIDYQCQSTSGTTKVKGVVTYVLVKKEDDWKIIHGQIHNNRLSNYNIKPI